MTGRKRHVAVDTLGNLLTVVVTPADVPDVDGAYAMLPAAKAVAPTLTHVWVDGGYEGDWAEWAAEEQQVTVEVVRRPPGQRGLRGAGAALGGRTHPRLARPQSPAQSRLRAIRDRRPKRSSTWLPATSC